MTTTVPATIAPTLAGPDGRQADAREKDVMRFRMVSGPDLTTRATVVSDTGVTTEGPGFGGQDCLSPTGHPAVLDASHQALRTEHVALFRPDGRPASGPSGR